MTATMGVQTWSKLLAESSPIGFDEEIEERRAAFRSNARMLAALRKEAGVVVPPPRRRTRLTPPTVG